MKYLLILLIIQYHIETSSIESDILIASLNNTMSSLAMVSIGIPIHLSGLSSNRIVLSLFLYL